MSGRSFRRLVAGAVAAIVSIGTVGLLPTAAHAASPVQPGNEDDIGVYTDGAHDAMEIGDPTYTNVAAVAEKLAPGVPFTADSMHQSIFDMDLAAGGTDYYLDRVLGVGGSASNNVLQTRGRTLYMRGDSNANFTTMGFAGSAFAGGPNNLGGLYTVTVPGQTVAEVGAERFNAPSHAKARYSIGTTGVVADLKKFITYDNVAVTAITFTNPGAADATFTLRAASPLATTSTESTDELVGSRNLTSGANNGLIDTPWSRITIGLKAPGFERSGTNLDRQVTVPAGGSVDLSVVGVLYTDSLPDSRESFYEYAQLPPAEAFSTAVTEFNRRWASDIPYIDVPDPAIEKAIVYRWWGERYNSLDANEPGYVYQYPVTIEGVNLYQNSIVLTQPMHLQDTKWIRTPYLAYGQMMNIGELSGSSAFLDSPGHTSWNNHYSQYIGTAGLEAYNVHGGGSELAERLAYYFEADGVGQLEHYDGNGDNLIAYDTNYMAGNDADAISFGYPKDNATAPGARTIERPESAYVWGDFDAASQLYALAGADPAKVDEMTQQADDIQTAILDRLWSDEMRMFLPGTSHGATSGGALNPLTEAERDLIPARESNLYDVYAQNLIPQEGAVRRRLPLPAVRRQLPDLPLLRGQPVRPDQVRDRWYEQLLEHQLHRSVPRCALGPALLRPRAPVRDPRVREQAPRLDGVERLPGRQPPAAEPGRVLLRLERGRPDGQPQQPEPRDAREHELHLHRGHGWHPAAFRRLDRAVAHRPRLRALHGQQPPLPRQ